MNRSPKQIALIACALFCVVLVAAALCRTGTSFDTPGTVPTFTSTAEWDPALLEQASRTLTTGVRWGDISLPPPPPYGSEEMNAELDMLYHFTRARTAATSEAILAEKDIQTATIGGYTVSELLYPENETALSRLLSYGWEDLATITLAEKAYYNRVRPHKADARIEPIIEVPKHAAYPSGHSTQSHYLALIIGLVYPDVADELMIRADEIAIHREIAGVHYPSDTEAGITLAEQFVTALQTDLVFQQLLTEAREEAQAQ